MGATIRTGEDDLGLYHYFDLQVLDEANNRQTIRFASHSSDKMVHLLAENIEAEGDLAVALFTTGIDTQTHLCVSTDHNGNPLRDLTSIKHLLEEAFWVGKSDGREAEHRGFAIDKSTTKLQPRIDDPVYEYEIMHD